MATNFTAAHIAALDEAIAAGVTKVTYNGKNVEFDSLESLIKRRNFVQAQIDGVQKSRRSFARFSKGVD